MVVHDAAAHDAQIPAPGNDVYTYDGKRLGTVRSNSDGFFRVHVRWGRDYWLSQELIHDCTPGRVTLHLSDGSVDQYKTRNPASAPATATSQPPGNSPANDGYMLQATAPEGDSERPRSGHDET